MQEASKKLHPSCRDVLDRNSFITDHYYFAINNLAHSSESGKIYLIMGAGHGYDIYVKRDMINGPIYAIMSSGEYDFIKGYRKVN